MSAECVYQSAGIVLYELTQPCCEIVDLKREEVVCITDLDDAIAIRDSLNTFIEAAND